MSEHVVNFSEPREAQLMLTHIRELQGQYRITLVKYRPRRTDRQNRYYWPCFVQPFAEWCKSQGNEWSEDECHEHLKWRFLKKEFTDEKTGEIIESSRSTTSLNTGEFNEYLDRCAQFLSEFCEIVVPQPATYRER